MNVKTRAVRPPKIVLPRTPAREGLSVFAAAAVLYLVAGVVLAWQGIFFGDALSRLQAAESVLFSRSPQLVNIGFVFTPLSTVSELPLVALSPWIPAMTSWALAGAIVSALFMAGAVRQVWLAGRDNGAGTGFLAVVTLLFAANPMIVLYGATGMSEAPFLFACAWATRRLTRFSRTDDVHDLMAAGLAVATAFLSRYDAVAAAAAGAAVVAGLALYRGRDGRGGSRSTVWGRAVTDAVVFLFPVMLAAGVWFAGSWLTTGTLITQVSGSYGNAAIIEASGGGATGGATEALVRVLLLAPGLPVLVISALVLGRRRHTPVLWAPLAVLGAVLVFQVMSAASGATFGFLRFFLVAVLMATMLALVVPSTLGDLRMNRPGRFPWDGGRHVPLSRPTLMLVATVALLAAGTVSAGATMTDRRWASQEYALAATTPLAGEMGAVDLEDRRTVLRTFSTERRLAAYLDDRREAGQLGDADSDGDGSGDGGVGSVLLDTTYGFPVPLFSAYPDTFVLPSDRDFVNALDDPSGHGVRFILAVPPEGRGAQDAVNRRYPTFWQDGGGIATLDTEIGNDGSGQPDFRLYRVLGTPLE